MIKQGDQKIKRYFRLTITKLDNIEQNSNLFPSPLGKACISYVIVLKFVFPIFFIALKEGGGLCEETLRTINN